MKTIFCILVLAGFSAAGMYASTQLNKRIHQLKGLQKAMLSMEREIDYELAPLKDAFCHTGERAEKPWNMLFLNIGRRLSETGKEERLVRQEKQVGRYPWEKNMNDMRSSAQGPRELMDEKLKIWQSHSWDKNMNDMRSSAQGPGELMDEELEKIKKFHPWDKDLNILSSLGRSLGEMDKNMQLSKIKIAQEEIAQAIEEAREEQQTKGKLYQTLGICMGVLGVILLW